MRSNKKNNEADRKKDFPFSECDEDELVDIRDVKINMELNKEDRIKDFLRQIKNPYRYKCNGMTVQISFSGEKKLEDCLKEIVF